MATPKGSFSQVVQKSAMKTRARKFRALPGPSGPQPCNYDHNSGKFPEQSSCFNDAPVRKPGASWPAMDSGAIQQASSSLNALGAVLLGGLQVKLLKNATAVLADAVSGSAAPPSLRLLVRRALRAAAMTACTASYVVKVWMLAGSLAHIDAAHGLTTEAELANTVCTVLSPAVAPISSPLLRAMAPVSALAADWLDVGTAVEGLTHPDAQHPADLAAEVGKAKDLLVACLSGAESCQELFEIALAAAPRAEKRDAGGCGNGQGGDKQ